MPGGRAYVLPLGLSHQMNGGVMAEHCMGYPSVEAFAAAAATQYNLGRYVLGRSEFSGVYSWDEVDILARDGWDQHLPDVMSAAERGISTVEADLDATAFHPVWDVSGCEVDVGRFLSGEPENMIDYEIVPTTKYGRVITLCASVSVSGVVSAENVRKRGTAIVALALAVSKLGYAIEIWADFSAGQRRYGGSHQIRSRILVKGANDELDVPRIMFAFMHPAMLRVLGFASHHEAPKEFKKPVSTGSRYGIPLNPKQDLPEGTIYVPCLVSDEDVADPDVVLRGYLTDLGIVE